MAFSARSAFAQCSLSDLCALRGESEPGDAPGKIDGRKLFRSSLLSQRSPRPEGSNHRFPWVDPSGSSLYNAAGQLIADRDCIVLATNCTNSHQKGTENWDSSVGPEAIPGLLHDTRCSTSVSTRELT